MIKAKELLKAGEEELFSVIHPIPRCCKLDILLLASFYRLSTLLDKVLGSSRVTDKKELPL